MTFSPRPARRLRPLAAFMSLACLFAPPARAAAPASAPPRGEAREAAPAAHQYLLHLPGIAGEMPVDRSLLAGLRDGGYRGSLEIYDWTAGDRGLNALFAKKRNLREAQKVADRIAEIRRKDPKAVIVLSGHSGGTGVAVWALERLPKGTRVDTLVLLASALSPGYDLSEALRHVGGRAYSFSSRNDAIVLGAGTRMLGTIDGVKEEAAGRVGFARPRTADEKEYEKLEEKSYTSAWLKYNNIGDHIGCLSRSFAAHVVAPLVGGTGVGGKDRAGRDDAGGRATDVSTEGPRQERPGTKREKGDGALNAPAPEPGRS